jgi:hypothetical protein
VSAAPPRKRGPEPGVSRDGEIRRLAREARLARALRDNLRRRKEDLGSRKRPATGEKPAEPEA